ncbi:hypothetical protein [Catenulispora subtropica]|uniref:Uncharacterized protein n=1 Tax=Catenulispora subtropica TaxID=450798 RepID=A0ABN2R457_9ACTN
MLSRLTDEANPSTPERELVIDLIGLVAVGYRDERDLPFDPDTVFAGAESAESSWEYAEALYGGDDVPEWEIVVVRFPDVAEFAHIAWFRDAYRAAAAEARRFGGWAASPDPAVAEAAAKLIVWFPAA